MQKRLLDRIVLDTNIIVFSALKGNFREIAALTVIHEVKTYTCEKQLIELERTFKKLITGLRAPSTYYLKLFEQLATVVEINERFDRSPDPEDNYLFDLAYTVKA